MINFFSPRFCTDADDTIIRDGYFEEFRIETGDEFLLFFPPFLSVVIRFLKVGYAFA